MKSLQKGLISKVDRKLIIPLIIWNSNNENNQTICKILNRYIFYIDNELAVQLLYRGIKPTAFIPYPKIEKTENKKIELINKYLIKEFKYSKSDLSQLQKILINKLNDKEFCEEFAQRYGLENKERKLLGLQLIKFDKSLMKPKAGIDLFSI